MHADAIFGALADLTRLRIMRMVATMELAVGEIAQVLGQSQPRVSRHIAVLSAAGLVERRREGSWVFVRAMAAAPGDMVDGAVRLVATAAVQDSRLGAICAEDRCRLAEIRQARESLAQDYFAAHAESWDEVRRLHCADESVERALDAALAPEPLGRVLDVGTGTGRIAEVFAHRADRIVALDKSPAMLRVARARLQRLEGARVEMVQGDFTSLPLPAQSIDTILFHQVLHFAQDPALALKEAARVTRPGGRVAIVDFAAHQREELRDRHAHSRLGFGDGQMQKLLAAAGYDPAPPVDLPEGELVVKIWVGRRRGGSPAGKAVS